VGSNEKAVYENNTRKVLFLTFLVIFLSLFPGVEATCRDDKSRAFRSEP
jgi:hypothetical protein